MNPYDEIIKLLKENALSYQEIEHEPVYTSEQAAAIRGISMKEGAKSLLIKANNTFILCIVPGDRRLDAKKVKKLLSAKSIRFASPEEVKNVMYCEVGSCYPFGNIIDIEQYVDPTLSENEYISFNPGIHTRSIRMRWKDYMQILNPRLTSLIKDEA